LSIFPELKFLSRERLFSLGGSSSLYGRIMALGVTQIITRSNTWSVCGTALREVLHYRWVIFTGLIGISLHGNRS
jgi:hypothetical protein